LHHAAKLALRDSQARKSRVKIRLRIKTSSRFHGGLSSGAIVGCGAPAAANERNGPQKPNAAAELFTARQ